MSNHAFIPILGKRLRTTLTDSCGRVASGEEVQLATDGFINVNLTAEVEDGTEILQRLASGALCVNEQLPNSFKRFDLEIEFCGVSPQLFTMMTHAEPYADHAGDIAGFTVREGEIDQFFAFELWTGLSGAACAPGAEAAGGYFLLPLVAGGTFGDVTIDGENAVNFTVTGAYTKGGNDWGVGPYNVLLNETGEASPLPTALDPFDHLLLMDTGLAPPPVATEAGPIPPGGGEGN